MKTLFVLFALVVVINASSYKLILSSIEKTQRHHPALVRHVRSLDRRYHGHVHGGGSQRDSSATANAQTQTFGGFGNNFGLPLYGGNVGRGSIGGGRPNVGRRPGAGAAGSGSADSTANAQTQTFSGNGFSGSASSASASSHSSGGRGGGAIAQASARS